MPWFPWGWLPPVLPPALVLLGMGGIATATPQSVAALDPAPQPILEDPAVVVRSPITDQVYRVEQLLDFLAAVDVIYLGETHDHEQDHAVQLAIIQALYARHPRIAIAFEMFQRPFQPVLDAYHHGTIDLATVRQQTDYDSRWGFPWEYYAPILHFAQTHQLPLLAANIPSEVTEQVALQGVNRLPSWQLRHLPLHPLPPLGNSDLDNGAYRQLLLGFFKEIYQQEGLRDDFKRFYQVQVLGDETMATTIAQFWRQHPDYQVVVLTGQGHIVYGYGIPDRVQRRLSPARDFQQRLVLIHPNERLAVGDDMPIADYLWLRESSVREPLTDGF